jgi:flagellar motor switch protein FliG
MIDETKELSDILKSMDVQFIGKVLYYLDIGTITNAMKTLDQEANDKILKSVSAQQAAMLKNKIAALGDVPSKDIKIAQHEILSLLHTTGDE